MKFLFVPLLAELLALCFLWELGKFMWKGTANYTITTGKEKMVLSVSKE
jgi:hypothetical protein